MPPPTPPHATLHGRRLLVARAAWMVLTGLIAGLSVTVLLVAHAHYLSGCVQGAVCRPFWQINAEDVPALRELGLSVGLYAAYGLAIEIVYLLGFWAIGAVIFWSRPNDRLALFFSLMLVSFGTVHATSVPVVMHPALDLLVTFFSFFVYLAFSAAFYVFPDGHFVPRWTRWVTIIWALYIAALYFLPEKPPFHPFTWPVPLSMGLVVGLFSSMVFAQIYRYQRVSGPVERQQTKWVVFGLTAAIAGVLIAALPSIVFEEEVDRPGVSKVLFALFELTVTNLSLLLIPLSIGIAILRYRLWDIDILINRTLVYGSLTATLGLVYYLGVVLLQGPLRLLTMQESPVAATASTLAVVALFMPLRRRIQKFIDRRFFRTKYNAQKILEAFGARVRDEVDLKKLSEALLEVVDETMKPSHISLWLRPPPKKNR